ncbi:MAG: class IV adenylate cyclase [Candidatus Aminicenantes bacterium]|nr:class IV adenylate cyclase [Candidatus Aminicenantes bacterium]
MAKNVEIKACLRDPDSFRRRLKAVLPGRTKILSQEDVYFKSRRGRLKLRVVGPRKGELIFYERPEAKGPKTSVYLIYKTAMPRIVRELLTAALGVRGVIKKIRRLYLVGQTRIHFDDVEGLGRFIEVEVVLRPGQSEEDGRRIAEGWLDRLGVDRADLLKGGYLDLQDVLESFGGKEG